MAAVGSRSRAGGDEGYVFNPLDPAYLADPYPHLTQLREQDPVHESPLGIWVLTRYEDVFALLRNPATSVEDANIQGGLNEMREAMFADLLQEFGGEERDRGDRAILNLDPPDHTRIRKLVSKAFTIRRVEQLRPSIQAQVDAALDRVEGGGPWDVVEELAFPLPFQVISELLGMPEGDRAAIRDWSHAITKTLDPIVSRGGHAGRLRGQRRDDRLPRRGRALEAGPPGRRRAHRPGPGRGGRRRPVGRRAAGPDRPALHRRPRDDGQPDRQRDAGPARPPGPDAALAGGPGPRRHRGRRAAALRRPRAALPPHHAWASWRSAVAPSPRARWS